MSKVATCHPDRKHFAKSLCSACYAKQHRQKHPEYREKMRSYSAEYRAANPDKFSAYAKSRRADPSKVERDKLKQADINYRAKYGMGLDDVQAMLESQGSKCKICECELTRDTANVDHCHSTGYVRGILCMKCNVGLGHLGDTVAALEKALAYLRQEPTSFRSN